MRVAARQVSCPGWSAIAAAHRDASAATAARSSSPPSTRKANGMAASHSCAYMVGLLVLPTSTHPLACVSRCPIGGGGPPAPPGGGALEKHRGGGNPPPPPVPPAPPPRAPPPGGGEAGGARC